MQKRVINKRRLSSLYIQKVQPLERAFLVWDADQKGLAVQVQPSGYRAFKVIYRHRNRSRWFHIGDAKAIGLADARTKAAELMLAVVRDGKDPAAEKRIGSEFTTFGVLASRYLEEHAKKRNKSYRQADALVRRHLLPAWSERDASAISRADVRAVLGRIAAPITANQTLAAGSAIFTWATRQEILSNNPCRGVERHATVSRERVLSDAEVPLFWQAFSNAGVSGTALQVLLLTGQRPGEVAHMRREHVVDCWWTMPGAPDAATEWPGTKNAQTHRVWLPQPVRDIIAELNDGDTGFVFGKAVALPAAMQRVCEQLKVPRATPHDLRRTHGTTLASLGFGRDAMNRIQNHREGGIASVYDRHQYADENKRIMETVAARLIALAEGTGAPSNVLPLQQISK
jgi:integrase